MQDATAETIKSLEGFRIAWVEEAQTLTHRSLSLLRPTIRVKGSQVWANWNPRRKSDAIDDFLRAKKPDNAIVVQANWRDNPWFPDVLDEERRLDLEVYPERYAHIWEGDYARAFEGAYFAKHLEQARQQGRIGQVAIDPILPVKAFMDIGGAGHSSDAMAIWICQFVGREIRLLDYIEGIGSLSLTMPASCGGAAGRKPSSACRTTALPQTTSPANVTSITGEKPALSVKRRSRTPGLVPQ
jgi:phage terminase large subunit